MNQWNLVVDVAKCTNCQLCVLACHDEYVGNRFPGYADEMPKHGHRWIEIKAREQGRAPTIDVSYLPVMCQHCDNAPCVAAAKDGAVSKRSDGIVIIDPEKSKGQRQLVDSCPYGAIWWNEEKQIPQHWIFDAHLLDAGWAEPRAVTVCATAALRAVKIDDEGRKNLIASEGLEELRPELGTKPRVLYKNLWRFTTCFIAGSVEMETKGTVDCLVGAKVELHKDGKKIAETTTDGYGDFKFERLKPESGPYRISISGANGRSKSLDAVLGESVNLGDIRI